MFQLLASQAKALIKECIELAWFMRGSIQYQTLLEMTPTERQMVGEFIEEHMKTIKNHTYPVY